MVKYGTEFLKNYIKLKLNNDAQKSNFATHRQSRMITKIMFEGFNEVGERVDSATRYPTVGKLKMVKQWDRRT